MTRARSSDSIAIRILSRVAVELNGCWRWLGYTMPNGYATMRAQGTQRLVHRMSYQAFVGHIPAGLTIDHLCRNRACVNPEHLEVCSSRENTFRGDSPSAINARKTCCPKGHEYDYTDSRGRRGCRRCKREKVRQQHRLRMERIPEHVRALTKLRCKRYRARKREKIMEGDHTWGASLS